MNWPFASTAAVREKCSPRMIVTEAFAAAWPPTSRSVTRSEPNGASVIVRSTISFSNVIRPVAVPVNPPSGSLAVSVKSPDGIPSNLKLPSGRVLACSSVRITLLLAIATVAPATAVVPSACSTNPVTTPRGSCRMVTSTVCPSTTSSSLARPRRPEFGSHGLDREPADRDRRELEASGRRRSSRYGTRARRRQDDLREGDGALAVGRQEASGDAAGGRDDDRRGRVGVADDRPARAAGETGQGFFRRDAERHPR